MPRSGGSYKLLPSSSHDLPQSSTSCSISEKRSKVAWPLLLLLLPLHLLKRLAKWQNLKRLLLFLVVLSAAVLSYTYFLNPSYANPPIYTVPSGSSVYIAANIVDSDFDGAGAGLVDGAWGNALVGLVLLLQAQKIHTFVGVYGGPQIAMDALETRLAVLGVERDIVSEDKESIDLGKLPRVEVPSGKRMGEKVVKRVAYLAEVRNKALQALGKSTKRYDKLLFMNDVVFKPADAERLMYGTKFDEKTGTTDYRAACALDFISSWKFYDTFASRDADGYGVGVPIFPWFGAGTTQDDLLSQQDAVRVKSCWGGMTAFDARFFQAHLPPPTLNTTTFSSGNNSTDTNSTVEDSRIYDAWVSDTFPGLKPNLPVRFRAEPHPLWDASECCLVHADIEAHKEGNDSGIYINPHVRTAYSSETFAYLPLIQRFERLFRYPQLIANFFSGMPRLNILREVNGTRSWDREISGVMEVDRHAKDDGGLLGNETYRPIDGFCQTRQLSLLREGPLPPGMKNWETMKTSTPPTQGW